MERDTMLLRNTVMPPMRPKVQGKYVTQDEAWLNDVGPLFQLSQLKAVTQEKRETVVGAPPGGLLVLVVVVVMAQLEPLLKDDSISEITCIGPRRTYVERNGLLEEVPCHFENEGQMVRVIEQMVRSAGQVSSNQAGLSLMCGCPIVCNSMLCCHLAPSTGQHLHCAREYVKPLTLAGSGA